MSVDPTRVLEFLQAIDRGEIEITPVFDPANRWAFYAGILEYRAANGWRLGVFVDAGEWDYVDWVLTADGERLRYEELDGFPALREYEPSKEGVVRYYRLKPSRYSGPPVA